MQAPSCSCCSSRVLASTFLLLLALPGWGGTLLGLRPAAEATPDSGAPHAGPGAPPSPPPGPTAARLPAAAAGPRAAESNGSSSPGAEAAPGNLGGKAGEEGAVGGGLAVSPNPGDKPLTQRALTVLMVVSGAVLVYFVVRTVRMRRRNRKTRRYGVLDTNIENMELTPLEQDDEDEDNTLFDASHPRR